MQCIAWVKDHAGLTWGQPEVKLLGIPHWRPNLVTRTPDQSLTHCGVKGHAEVIRGQSEGNRLEVHKTTKCSPCHFMQLLVLELQQQQPQEQQQQ